MIKNITTSGDYLIVSGGMPPSTYVNQNSNTLGAGNVRFNSITQSLEVYDGYNWMPIMAGYVNIALTPEAKRLLDWARIKCNEETMLEAKAKDNPSLADLLRQKKKIDEQIKIIETLIGDNRDDTD